MGQFARSRERRQATVAISAACVISVAKHVVELANVGMVQRGNRTGLAVQAAAVLRFKGFDRDRATQASVTSFIHLSHPPAPMAPGFRKGPSLSPAERDMWTIQ
jgi:hypothetical protein